MEESLPLKRRKTNSISPTKMLLPDWKDIKANKSMTLNHIFTRRLSIAVDDDVGLS